MLHTLQVLCIGYLDMYISVHVHYEIFYVVLQLKFLRGYLFGLICFNLVAIFSNTLFLKCVHNVLMFYKFVRYTSLYEQFVD